MKSIAAFALCFLFLIQASYARSRPVRPATITEADLETQLQPAIVQIRDNIDCATLTDVKFAYTKSTTLKRDGLLSFMVFSAEASNTGSSDTQEEGTVKVPAVVSDPAAAQPARVKASNTIAKRVISLAKAKIARFGSNLTEFKIVLIVKDETTLTAGGVVTYLVSLKGNLSTTTAANGTLTFSFDTKGCAPK